MKFMIKWGLLLIPAFALAMPALAQDRPTILSDSQEPGSVLIFPKFINMPPVHVDVAGSGPLLPRTEIELAVVCPPGVTPSVGPPAVCVEHQQFKVRAHWVCPGSQDPFFKYVCQETSFNLFVSLDGKISFPADGGTYFSNQPHVPKPQCKNGYLIVWMVNLADQPIKWDGLIGDAVLRSPANPDGGAGIIGVSTNAAAYSAIPIQADPGALLNQILLTEGNELHFDGGTRHYQAVTGKLFADIKFDNQDPADPDFPTPAHTVPSPGNAFTETFLILLTLDVNSNHPNFPTFANVVAHNESFAGVSSTNPLFEFYEDGFTEFLCWEQVQLSVIDSNFNQLFMGTRKGTLTIGPAEKLAIGGVGDETGPSTLLGLVHTVEGTLANRYQERSYLFNMYNDSYPVSTEFELLPTGD